MWWTASVNFFILTVRRSRKWRKIPCCGFLKKLKPYTVKKGLRYLKHYGLKGFLARLAERMEPEEVPYGPWYEAHRASEETLSRQRKENGSSPRPSALPCRPTGRRKNFCGRCWILFWPKAIPTGSCVWSMPARGRFHGRDSGRVREPG